MKGLDCEPTFECDVTIDSVMVDLKTGKTRDFSIEDYQFLLKNEVEKVKHSKIRS